MTFQRKTLTGEAVFEGIGLHSGVPVRVRVLPGQDGIGFRYGADRVAAVPENVADTTRCTRLGPVSTIEHLMSALAGTGVTDCEVEVSAPELPSLDGASLAYVQGLESAGFTEIGNAVIEGPFARVYEKEPTHEVAIAAGEGWWRYLFVSEGPFPGNQDFEISLTQNAYRDQVAPARTFGFEEELERIRAAGLAKGLDESNAFLIGKDRYLSPGKFPDEPVRHKLLDLIGDLYLSGVPPQLLNVVAERSGHTANVRAAGKLRQAVRIVPV